MAADTTKGSQSLADVYDSIKDAVVTVETPDGNGSGFAVREDGIVVTNQTRDRRTYCGPRQIYWRK